MNINYKIFLRNKSYEKIDVCLAFRCQASLCIEMT